MPFDIRHGNTIGAFGAGALQGEADARRWGADYRLRRRQQALAEQNAQFERRMREQAYADDADFRERQFDFTQRQFEDAQQARQQEYDYRTADREDRQMHAIDAMRQQAELSEHQIQFRASIEQAAEEAQYNKEMQRAKQGYERARERLMTDKNFTEEERDEALFQLERDFIKKTYGLSMADQPKSWQEKYQKSRIKLPDGSEGMVIGDKFITTVDKQADMQKQADAQWRTAQANKMQWEVEKGRAEFEKQNTTRQPPKNHSEMYKQMDVKERIDMNNEINDLAQKMAGYNENGKPNPVTNETMMQAEQVIVDRYFRFMGGNDAQAEDWYVKYAQAKDMGDERGMAHAWRNIQEQRARDMNPFPINEVPPGQLQQLGAQPMPPAQQEQPVQPAAKLPEQIEKTIASMPDAEAQQNADAIRNLETQLEAAKMAGDTREVNRLMGELKSIVDSISNKRMEAIKRR